MAIFIWIVLTFGCAIYASNKGRDGGRWFVISLLLSPLIGFILLLISKDISQQTALEDGLLKKCPACAELIKTEAVKCKHCGVAV